MIPECFLIALLSFSHNYSIAKYYSSKDHYSIHSNQELFAYGAANIFASFFQCFASGASSSRTMVQHKFGGKTQVNILLSVTEIIEF
jgi:MFS superfamily sulfate permease-like transporter